MKITKEVIHLEDKVMTNKLLLEEIIIQQKKFISKTSIFMNEQNLFNQRISGLLERDESTNTKGAIQDLGDLKDRVSDLEIKNKITAGNIAISVVILTAIGSVIWKLLGLFD